MKKIIIKSTVFSIIFLIILFVSTRILKPYSEHEKIIEDIYKEQRDSLDVIFLGDSSVYKGISTPFLWDEYKFTSYDLVSPAQRIWDNYYVLKEVLKYQKPKVVVLNTDQIYNEKPLKEGYKRFLYDSIKLGRNKIEAISDPVQENTKMEQLSFLMPILRYHSRWNELKDIDFEINNKEKYDCIFKGFWLLKKAKPYSGGNEYTQKNSNDEIPKKTLEYLDKIIEICKYNNIEFVMIEVPTPKVWNKTKHEQIQKIAEERNIPFIDTNMVLEEIGIDWEKDTPDNGGHLNVYGAEKVSKYIGKYLYDNYEFDNYKKENVFNTWEQTLKDYNEYKNKN